MRFTCCCTRAGVVSIASGAAAAAAAAASTTGTGTDDASGMAAASCGGGSAGDTGATVSTTRGSPLVAPAPVPLLVTVLAGTPVTAINVLACLSTADVNSLRRLHPALPAAVAAVPWADTDAAVVNVVRWRKVLPVAAGARFTRRAVGDPARAVAALAGVTHVDQQGGAFVRAKLLRRLPASSVRVLNVSSCCNLAANTSFTRFKALVALNCSRTKVIDDWAGGLPSWLRELDISCAIGMWHSVSLVHLRALQVLRATGSALGDATLASLPPSLVELHASQCVSLSKAASFAPLPALRVLDVSKCPIGYASLASLPPSLVRLDIRKCCSPAAVLPRLPALKTLDAGGSAIGDALVASLPVGLLELRLTSCHYVTCAATFDHLPALRLLHGMDTRLDHTVLAACRARGTTVPPAIQLLFGPPFNELTLSVLADGRLACACGTKVQVWDVARAVETAAMEVVAADKGIFYTLAPLPDGRRLAVGTASGPWDASIDVWDVQSSPPVRCSTIDCGGKADMDVLAVQADGRVAAACERFDNVWIVDVDAGSVAAVFEGHTDHITTLAALPDGRLASGSRDKTVRIWEVGARACVATLAGHTDVVETLAVLADGRLASGARNGTVRLWDVGAATCVGVLDGHQGGVAVLAALPDGRLAISSWNSATIRLWDTRPAAAAATMHVLELGQYFRSIRKLVPLQDGRLACACCNYVSVHEYYARHVYLLEVPPPAAC